MDPVEAEERASGFAGGAALVLAVVTALAAIFYVLLPAEQRLGIPGRLLLPSFVANPLTLHLEIAALTAMGVVGLAIVQPIRRLVGRDDEWLHWASLLALIGYAVAAVGQTLTWGKLPGVAAAFVAADDAAKPAIAALWRTTLDPWGLWQFGAVGLWLLVVGIVGLRGRSLPQTGAYLAIAAGVAHIVIPLLLIARAEPALVVVSIVAAIVMVVWFAWVGLYLRRGGEAANAR